MSSERNSKEITKPVVEPVDVGVCVICQESIADNDDERTIVNLRCNHVFHLDCIGSFFNSKNKMECPCCRHTEKGDWLIPQPAEPSSPTPDTDFDILGEGADNMRSLPAMVEPTMMWIDEVLSSVEDYVERLFANSFNSLHSPYEPNHVPSPYDSNPMQPPDAPDQIRDNGIMRYGIWRDNLSLEVWLERQVDEHIALIADSQHQLQRMMYEYQRITGGISIDGESSDWGGNESSGGGDGESNDGDAMAEEEVEMMEE
ncbi:hypothetical protein CARUB_v10006446mg [Capsella rubella]|uniref:RING-type domain-containing protein n=1 Tax=Capsella rubella TaxID=81985 RepID=R0F8S0_9BRAS|nr:hypothetical protein CARUB_v10006446mg [Capsella rubella]